MRSSRTIFHKSCGDPFYSEEARTTQRRFFDRYLKGENNGWEETPRVRLEVRRSREEYDVRAEAHWRLTDMQYTALYLDARSATLSLLPVSVEATARHDPKLTHRHHRASFSFHFDRETELTGEMKLKLRVSTSEGNDLDLFVVLRKFDAAGREIYFIGYNGFPEDGVAKGWLRVSHRRLDPERSRMSRPWHAHRTIELVALNEIVPVEIEILPSSTLFEAGTRLQLDMLGHDAARYPVLKHRRTANNGRHSIHTGGLHDSHLLVPIVNRASHEKLGYSQTMNRREVVPPSQSKLVK